VTNNFVLLVATQNKKMQTKKRKQQKLQTLQQRERERERARKIANFAKTKERTKQFATKRDGESC
jgi:hypothetical protein